MDSVLERNASVTKDLAPPARRRRSTRCPAASPISRTIGEALDYAATGERGLNFHDARGTLTRAYPFPSCARMRCSLPAASLRSASSRATASHWSPRRAPSSPPRFSARSMPAPGRFRCRCRPASAGAKPMSTSSAVQLKSCDPALLLYPPELADFCARRGRRAPVSVARPGIRSTTVEPARAICRRPSPRRHRLSPIFERLDPLPARRRGHPPRAARQSPFAWRRPGGRRHRPRAFPGCPGITTWAWSAASCRRSRCRCRSII